MGLSASSNKRENEHQQITKAKVLNKNKAKVLNNSPNMNKAKVLNSPNMNKPPDEKSKEGEIRKPCEKCELIGITCQPCLILKDSGDRVFRSA